MPIQVICPGCHARFQVSDKFAGQQGPCPKCKMPIQIPAADQTVKIHEPEHEAGARTAEGELVLKPIERKESKVQPLLIAAAVGSSLVVLAVALMIRGSDGQPPTWLLGLGALLLGPPLATAGYVFLRSDEDLEPYEGVNLWIRATICGAVYALLWAVFPWIYGHLYGTDPVALPWLMPLAAAFWAVGAGAAYCCFDIDYGSGFFHYGLYLLVTVLLRLLIGLPAVGPAESQAGVPPSSAFVPIAAARDLVIPTVKDATSWPGTWMAVQVPASGEDLREDCQLNSGSPPCPICWTFPKSLKSTPVLG